MTAVAKRSEYLSVENAVSMAPLSAVRQHKSYMRKLTPINQ